MPILQLAHDRCVRTRSPAATCQRCVEVCPTEAISLQGATGLVEVELDDCVACGLCVAACPPEAFRGAFELQALIDVRPREVRCGVDGLPCVGALAPEDLLTLAVAAGGLTVVAQACAAGLTGHPRAKGAVEEAQRLANAVGVAITLSWRDEAPPLPPRVPKERPAPIPERRRFLGLFVPRAVPPRGPRLSAPEGLVPSTGSPAPRRQRLLSALPSSAQPAMATAPLRCTSTKVVDPGTCSSCGACAAACPTAALSIARKELRFDQSRCVACGVCEEVCVPHAISSAPEVRVIDLLEFQPRILTTLTPQDSTT